MNNILTRMLSKSIYTLVLLSSMLLVACQRGEIIPASFAPTHAHQSYAQGLSQTGLDDAALGQDWLGMAEAVLEHPTTVEVPYAEIFHFDERETTALGYSFTTVSGERVVATLEAKSDTDMQVFVDLFRIDNDSLNLWTHVATADENSMTLAFEAHETATYVLRIQPELLRGGNFQLTLEKGPSLAFPVLNGDNYDIGSFFGDPRDGGRRKHHGVDIFARRHTPIISPVRGRVRFAGERGRGGKVVWLRDRGHRQTLYFAHLHDIFVESDQLVDRGDTLGTVGNTGNARTTPPHLHFGIYSHGPVDPYPYIALVNKRPPAVNGDLSLLGEMVRSKIAIDVEGVVVADKHQLMKLLGLFDNECRVKLPSGLTACLPFSNIESAEEPIRLSITDKSYPLLARPDSRLEPAVMTQPNESLSFHGKNDDFWLVKNQEGTEGWLMLE